MMKKSIICLLIISMLLPLAPTSVYAVLREDESNVADLGYAKDIVYFNETEGNITCSSGGIDRWQSIAGASKRKTQDPLDATNNVFALTSSSSGYLTKCLFWSSALRTTDRVSFSFDFFLPSHAEAIAEEVGEKNQTVTFAHAAEPYVKFTYHEDAELYTYEMFGKTGTIAADGWHHISFLFLPYEDGTQHLALQLSGEGLTDENHLPIPYLVVELDVDYTGKNLGQRTNLFQLQLQAAEGYSAKLLVDNTKLVEMYDFAPATVETEVYEGDGFLNFDLEGKITVRLHHELDLRTVDLSRVRVSDSRAQTLSYASVSFLPCTTNVVVLDFAGHTLPAFTDIFICFDDTFLDLAGESMHETVIRLKTKGERGETPPPENVITIPKEGIVMPDQWNTGYRCAREELVPFEEKYPEFEGKSEYNITESIARKYNYEFSHFVSNKTISVMTASPVYLHDFLQDGAPIWNGKNGPYEHSQSLTIAWMEGCNNTTSNFFNNMRNATISHCYVHDVKGDHIQGIDGLTIEYCYFRDGGTRSPGAHADIIQFSGNSSYVCQNIKIYGNRFDAPPMLYDHVANACVFFSPEEERTYGFNDLQIVGNWFNGGGYTTYIAPEDHNNTYGRVNQIYYNYNQWGYGHNFKPLSCSYRDENSNPDLSVVNGTYIENGYVDTLHVGSVVFYNGTGEDASRVFAISDLTAGEGKIMLNFANYMTVARNYRVEVTITNEAGQVVYTQTKDGEIRRYTPVKEYATDDNKEFTGLYNPENNSPIYQLINKPDLPHDVNEYIDLAGLPADLAGHTMSVAVYDTTDAGETFIRSAEMTTKVADKATHKAPSSESTVTVDFVDADGNLLSRQTLTKGQDATPPVAPVRENCLFLGWSSAFTNVQSDIVIYPLYEQFYTVTFLGKDREFLSTVTVGEGKGATAPQPPTYDGFSFVKWSVDFSAVYENMIVCAEYQMDLDANQRGFVYAVRALVGLPKNSPTQWLGILLDAERYYGLIEDKTDARVEEAYQQWLGFIEEYNLWMNAINQTAAEGAKVSCITLERGNKAMAHIQQIVALYS